MSSLNVLGMFRCQLWSKRGLLGRGLQVSAIAATPKKKTNPTIAASPKKRTNLKLYPEFDGPLPPKRWTNQFIVYLEERCNVIGHRKENVKTVAAEWRQMSADQKKEYELKSQNCREDYNRKLYEVLQSVGGVEDQKDYLMKLAKYQAAVRAFRKDKNKPWRLSVYNVMIMDRIAKLPKEERQDYLLHKASKDFKNLTPSQVKSYGKAAEDINKHRMEEYKKKYKAQ